MFPFSTHKESMFELLRGFQNCLGFACLHPQLFRLQVSFRHREKSIAALSEAAQGERFHQMWEPQAALGNGEGQERGHLLCPPFVRRLRDLRWVASQATAAVGVSVGFGVSIGVGVGVGVGVGISVGSCSVGSSCPNSSSSSSSSTRPPCTRGTGNPATSRPLDLPLHQNLHPLDLLQAQPPPRLVVRARHEVFQLLELLLLRGHGFGARHELTHALPVHRRDQTPLSGQEPTQLRLLGRSQPRFPAIPKYA
mmetsp:Transcript_82774/g.165531  ORF Transcript_82774/g.165531 Transcript_82774/m.165531 type:complete len:252 (+) Transcript_82774:163-918(+)